VGRAESCIRLQHSPDVGRGSRPDSLSGLLWVSPASDSAGKKTGHFVRSFSGVAGNQVLILRTCPTSRSPWQGRAFCPTLAPCRNPVALGRNDDSPDDAETVFGIIPGDLLRNFFHNRSSPTAGRLPKLRTICPPLSTTHHNRAVSPGIVATFAHDSWRKRAPRGAHRGLLPSKQEAPDRRPRVWHGISIGGPIVARGARFRRPAGIGFPTTNGPS
jgi:hypothetical protein